MELARHEARAHSKQTKQDKGKPDVSTHRNHDFRPTPQRLAAPRGGALESLCSHFIQLCQQGRLLLCWAGFDMSLQLLQAVESARGQRNVERAELTQYAQAQAHTNELSVLDLSSELIQAETDPFEAASSIPAVRLMCARVTALLAIFCSSADIAAFSSACRCHRSTMRRKIKSNDRGAFLRGSRTPVRSGSRSFPSLRPLVPRPSFPYSLPASRTPTP